MGEMSDRSGAVGPRVMEMPDVVNSGFMDDSMMNLNQ